MELSQKPVLGVVGLGLIGGSFAIACRDAGATASVRAWDRSSEALEEGVRKGVVDAADESLEALLENVDVLLLSAPTIASTGLLETVLKKRGRIRAITDVASVKAPLQQAAQALGGEDARYFVPGHPIAGSERSGVSAAHGDLFRAHKVILTPDSDTHEAAREEVAALWTAVGAQVHYMSVEEHDRVLAATSHLPHMLAYALVDALAASPTRSDIFRFAAGGFRDFSRIASSDPEMWRDVALANRGALLETLDEFEQHLATLRRYIEEGNGEALEKLFRDAKAVRDEFGRHLERRVRRGTVADRRH